MFREEVPPFSLQRKTKKREKEKKRNILFSLFVGLPLTYGSNMDQIGGREL